MDQRATEIPGDRSLASLRARFPLSRCPKEVNRVLSDLDEACVQRSSETRLSVAFSGGADSLFTVLWILAWFPNVGQAMDLLHFNHGTRPEENLAEEERVRRWAKELNLRIVVGRSVDPASSTEAALREARFAFFVESMRGSGSDTLALGHQADDVAENFLMRLARGSGLEGLAAPRAVSLHGGDWPHKRIRPVLDIPADPIREFLKEENLEFVVDPSNREGDYLRNRLRARVVPAWKEVEGREVLTGISRSRSLLEEATVFLERAARKICPNGWDADEIAVECLRDEDPAPVRFAIQRWLAAHEISVVGGWVDALVSATVAGDEGRWSAGKNLWVVLDKNALRIAPVVQVAEWEPVSWPDFTTLYLPDGSALRRGNRSPDARFYNEVIEGRNVGPNAVFLQIPGANRLGLTVRRWREGDRFKPLGAPGSRKLQDWFTDRKIDPALRKIIPIVSLGEEIIWVPGFPPADRHRLLDAEEKLLGLTYEPR